MMPARSDNIAGFRKELRQSMHLPVTHLNAPTVFETQSGQVGAMLSLAGIPFDTADPDELNYFRRIWHQALCGLNEDVGLYAHLLREKMDIALSGTFPDAFSRHLDTAYHRRFKSADAYCNSLYITLLLKPVMSGKASRGLAGLTTGLSKKKVAARRDTCRSRAVRRLDDLADQLTALLKPFSPYRLGTHDGELGYSELLHVLSKQLNGLRPLYLKMHRIVPPLSIHDPRLADRLRSAYPDGHIGQCLAASRLFFGGDTLEIRQGGVSRFARIVSIKSYGSETSPLVFNRLLELDCQLMATHSFLVAADHTAHTRIRRQAIRLENAADAACSQLDALHDLRDDLASERLRTGLHHHTVMMLSETLDALNESVRAVNKVFVDAGFTPVLEDTGLEAAYFAQFAGNRKYIARDSLVTSENMADFFPLHNYRTGYRDGNHLGAAVTVWETPSRTPVFFNYHRKGSGKRDDYTAGHATIIGGNGSGKTTLMAFTDAQMGRYGGRSFLFDRDRGLELYVRACGGHYLILHPDHAVDCVMNPFALTDTAANRAFLTDWLSVLVGRDDERTVSAAVRHELKQCVDYVYRHLEPSERCLSEAVRHLGRDFERGIELSEWIRPCEAMAGGGDYAYLFDHAADKLNVGVHKLGVDLTFLMTQPEKVLTATMMYLFHRIEETLCAGGERVSLFVDEGWQVLQNRYWAEKLDKWLPTLRKRNCHIVLATQSPSSVVRSPLCAKFLDNSACNIFACNDKADRDDYKRFNVSEYEFRFIKDVPVTKRLFLYKQDHESCVCKLDLAGMDQALAVLAGNRNTVALCERVRAEVGDRPEDWLPLFYRQREEESRGK